MYRKEVSLDNTKSDMNYTVQLQWAGWAMVFGTGK